MGDFVLAVEGLVTGVASNPDAFGTRSREAIEVETGSVKNGYILQSDGEFVPPPQQTVPLQKLTRFQFEVILELLGITQTQVFALIDGLPWADMDKIIAKKKVETGGNDGRWSRENPLWDLLGPSLGISKEQIDEKWLEAQAL
jgi:hypothetical protein